MIVILIFKSGVPGYPDNLFLQKRKELARAVVPGVKLAERAGRLSPMQKYSSVVGLPEVLKRSLASWEQVAQELSQKAFQVNRPQRWRI